MAELITKKGLKFFVDDNDLEIVSRYKWCATKSKSTHYLKADSISSGKRYCILMHRLIVGAISGQIVDHINGNGLDNRRENLRIVTSKENSLNKRKSVTSNYSSRYKGVYYGGKTRLKNKWVAQIGLDNKRIRIGSYKTEAEAAIAYNEMAIKLYGEYAKLNEVIL